MNSLLITIAEIALIIISLGSLCFGIYLRRKLYFRKKAEKSFILTLTYKGSLSSKSEILYKPHAAYKLKTVNLNNRIQVNKSPLGYVLEADYSQDFISCLK